MNPPKTIEMELEIVPNSALEAMQRAEIDTQIATAHKFPRSMQLFKKRATEMATLDEETAASCIYSRPVGGGKFAEGLSIRMAEIVGAAYGNLRVGAMIISQSERQVVVRGFAHDLESNFASTSEVVEATIKRDGTPYDERMRVVIAKAALAKARRDATFQVVPKALCKPIESEARKVAIGDASTLNSRRDQVMGWIGKLGIDANRVFAVLGIKGADEIGLEELAKLTGIKTAIKDGEATVDESFPAILATGSIGAKPSDKPASGASITEQAAAEKTQPPAEQSAAPAKTEEKPIEKPAPKDEPKGPKASDLLAQIIAKGTEVNAGKVGISKALRSLKLMEPAETLEKLEAKRLADILDAWPSVLEKIKNPEA